MLSEADPTRQPCGARQSWSRCLCDCGKISIVRNNSLTAGNTKSCGCRQAPLRHGHVVGGIQSHTYSSWKAMMQRCCNPHSMHAINYSARGIRVCDQWRQFENFLADMGERPDGTTLHRIDNDGNYEPGNCKWASRLQQSRNRRNSRIITHLGVSGCLPELIEHFDILVNKDTIRRRLRRGWKTDIALSEPPEYGRRPTQDMLI